MKVKLVILYLLTTILQYSENSKIKQWQPPVEVLAFSNKKKASKNKEIDSWQCKNLAIDWENKTWNPMKLLVKIHLDQLKSKLLLKKQLEISKVLEKVRINYNNRHIIILVIVDIMIDQRDFILNWIFLNLDRGLKSRINPYNQKGRNLQQCL